MWKTILTILYYLTLIIDLKEIDLENWSKKLILLKLNNLKKINI